MKLFKLVFASFVYSGLCVAGTGLAMTGFEILQTQRHTGINFIPFLAATAWPILPLVVWPLPCLSVWIAAWSLNCYWLIRFRGEDFDKHSTRAAKYTLVFLGIYLMAFPLIILFGFL